MVLDSYHDWKGSGGKTRSQTIEYNDIIDKCLNITEDFKLKLTKLLKILTGKDSDHPNKSFETQLVTNVIKKIGISSSDYYTEFKKQQYDTITSETSGRFNGYIKNANFPDETTSLELQFLGLSIYDFFYKPLSEGSNLYLFIDALNNFEIIYYLCNSNIIRYPYKAVQNYYSIYDAAGKGVRKLENRGYLNNRLSTDFLIRHMIKPDARISTGPAASADNYRFDFKEYRHTTYRRESIFDRNIINKNIGIGTIYDGLPRLEDLT